jgi:hypothetical protein
MEATWMSTKELLAAIKPTITRRVFTYLKKKYRVAIQPVKVIGGQHFWDPSLVPTIEGLRQRMRAYKQREGKKA